MFCLWPQKKRHSSEWVGETSPWPKKLKFQKSHIKSMLANFFASQGIVHKEFLPDGKTVNAEFYKGVMDHLLKCIQQVRLAAFSSQDFSLLHNSTPTKLCLPIFDPKKCYNALWNPVLSWFKSAKLFSVPQVENEVKRTRLYGCCRDPRSPYRWIKKVQKEEFLAAFQKLYNHTKA